MTEKEKRAALEAMRVRLITEMADIDPTTEQFGQALANYSRLSSEIFWGDDDPEFGHPKPAADAENPPVLEGDDGSADEVKEPYVEEPPHGTPTTPAAEFPTLGDMKKKLAGL